MTACIRDDGQGFDASAVLRSPWQDRGLGLAGMQERAMLLDGTVKIESQPGGGTIIDVAIPLPTSAQPAGGATDEDALPVDPALAVS